VFCVNNKIVICRKCLLVFVRFCKFSLEKREQNAHEEAIWAADWYRTADGDVTAGRIITGALDDTVKVGPKPLCNLCSYLWIKWMSFLDIFTRDLYLELVSL
jgi:hypothetical protein